MEVILLQRIGRLGQMGDVVRVKDGFARNFLLPKGKALRATKENRTRFESMKTELEVRNLAQRGEAEKVAAKLDGKGFVVVRQAAEGGQLYGSVSTRDIAAILAEAGFMVDRSQIELNAPIKTIGLHTVPVALHPEVAVVTNVDHDHIDRHDHIDGMMTISSSPGQHDHGHDHGPDDARIRRTQQ